MRLLLPFMFCKADELEPERLVIVANRLPVTCSKDAEGGWQLQVRGGMKRAQAFIRENTANMLPLVLGRYLLLTTTLALSRPCVAGQLRWPGQRPQRSQQPRDSLDRLARCVFGKKPKLRLLGCHF